MKLWYSFCMETTIRIMGEKIRQLRVDNRLTLEEAAERAGCTPGFLSQVERNQAVPSITLLYAIAHALGVEVAHFFPRMSRGVKVIRADERETFRFEGSFLIYSLLSTSFPDRKLESLLVQVDPVDGALPADEFRSHPGEEFACVLEGTLRLWIGDAIYDLNPGDSVHFKSTVKHRLENLADNPAVALFVLTPPVF
jgi:transcriptional regulator with XRE-family HTH domain